MPRTTELNLSGRWSGIYNCPHTVPPTAFEAEIRDSGGFISGETTEPGGEGGTLHAMIEGRREGDELRFVKTYDDAPRAHYWIDYVGTIAEGGDEIHGQWQIPGNWSGTFLMVRDAGAEEEVELVESAAIQL